MVVEVAVVAGIGQNLWGKYGRDVTLAVGGAGDESGVAFAVQASADLLGKVVLVAFV